MVAQKPQSPPGMTASEEPPRKRKRSQKEKEKPSSRTKRPRTADGDEELDHDDHPVLDAPLGHESVGAELNTNGDQANGDDLTYKQRHKLERRRKRKERKSSNGTAEDTSIVNEDDKDTQIKTEKSQKDHKTKAHPQRTDKSVGKVKTSTWKTTQPAAGRFTRNDAVYSRDEKCLFAATPRAVHVLSIADSVPEASIPAPSGGSISAFALSPADPNRLYIASSSGRVQCWDWTLKQLVGEPLARQGPVTGLAIAKAEDEEEEVVFAVETSNDKSVILRDGKPIFTSDVPLRNLHVQGDYIIASSTQSLVVGTSTTNGEDAQDQKYRFVELKTAGNTTCIASRLQASTQTAKKNKSAPKPSLHVAVGSTTGEIHVYEDVASLLSTGTKNTSSVPSLSNPRTLHWHRDAVEALKWSRDGNYIISGGRETVLVIWQIQTGKKQFLPHLTAEIETITVSPTGSSYAIQLADNSIMVLSTSELKPIANFAGLQAQQDDKVAASLHPTRHEELLLAVPSSLLLTTDESKSRSKPFLQTFDTFTCRHISRQALTRNNVTDFNIGPEGNKIRMPNVSFLQLSHDGNWMATVEEWRPPGSDSEYLAANQQVNDKERNSRREVYLKIWQWSTERSLWVLESRIDNPHPFSDGTSSSRVLSLVADPVETGFASVGEDGCVRIWKPKTRLRNGVVVRGTDAEGLVDWSCRHSIHLEQDSDLTESHGRQSTSCPSSARLSYSDDGSVLAASQAFGGKGAIPAVHFIQTESGEITQSRPGLYTGNLAGMGFLDRYLIILSTSSLSVWDVVTETISYRIELPRPNTSLDHAARLPLLCISHADKTIAIGSTSQQDSVPSTQIQIFTPQNKSPIFTHDYTHLITAILSAPSRKGYTLLTSTAEILHLSASVTVPFSQALVASTTTAEETPTLTTTDQETAADSDPGTSMHDNATSSQTTLITSLDDESTDRPVVRPEQLARVFDSTGGQNAAFMPVRAMFEAVVDLFGRKPAVGGVEV